MRLHRTQISSWRRRSSRAPNKEYEVEGRSVIDKIRSENSRTRSIGNITRFGHALFAYESGLHEIYFRRFGRSTVINRPCQRCGHWPQIDYQADRPPYLRQFTVLAAFNKSGWR